MEWKSKLSIDHVTQGDCRELIPLLPDASIDVVVTSPPYWGQRVSHGTGAEDDPREYLAFLVQVFTLLTPKLKPEGIVWINIGDEDDLPIIFPEWPQGEINCPRTEIGTADPNIDHGVKGFPATIDKGAGVKIVEEAFEFIKLDSSLGSGLAVKRGVSKHIPGSGMLDHSVL